MRSGRALGIRAGFGRAALADLYLNWGCKGVQVQVCAEPHYQIAGAYGLGSGTMPLMSSSYIDPLGLKFPRSRGQADYATRRWFWILNSNSMGLT